ncbi:MAG TPA: response regulator transcription factor [Verrucomicrobiae bacterium]|nr:response regulator transcription factor [Verrucomicrobiae bacterium]
MKILIADDSDAMRNCIRALISAEVEVVECRNGREAVRAYAAGGIDWALMDIEMPEQDGLSAAREIKAHHPDAHILFVTGHDGPRLRAEAALLSRAFVLKDRLDEIGPYLSGKRISP